MPSKKTSSKRTTSKKTSTSKPTYKKLITKKNAAILEAILGTTGGLGLAYRHRAAIKATNDRYFNSVGLSRYNMFK